MATQRFLSSTNGFIPQATGQVISFMRKPNLFKVNKYTQVVNTPVRVGVYARVDRDASARVVSDADFVWADGSELPRGHFNQLRFQWIEFATTRRAYPFQIGNMALEAAEKSWKPLEMHTAMVIQQAMTNRTDRVVSLLETAANWQTNGLAHAQDANTLNGGAGNWKTASDDPASANFNAIKNSLTKALEIINLDTNGLVQPEDLCLLLSPDLCRVAANSAEIHAYLRSSPAAEGHIEDGGNPNEQWGLPKRLYGIDVIVEDAVKVTERPAASGTEASTNRVRIKKDTTAILTSRKGGFDGQYMGPNYATVQIYFHKWQAAVKIENDPINEFTRGWCIEDFKEVLAFPEGGFLITGCQ